MSPARPTVPNCTPAPANPPATTPAGVSGQRGDNIGAIVLANQRLRLDAGAVQNGPNRPVRSTLTVPPNGPIQVDGGALSVNGATLFGSRASYQATAVDVCGLTLNGDIDIESSSGLLVIGGDAATATCAPRHVSGPVPLTPTQAGDRPRPRRLLASPPGTREPDLFTIQ